MPTKSTAAALLISWLAMGNPLPASLITSGFNVSEGYVAGSSASGESNTDPGWNGSDWVIRNGGGSVAPELGLTDQTAPPSPEGGLALHMTLGSAGETWAYRTWGAELTGSILIEQYIRVPTGGMIQSRPGSGGIGELIAVHWIAHSNGAFLAMDGEGNGSGPMEDTGFDVVPNQWHKVATLIDQVSQTYRIFVDDQEYLAPDPLNFRGGAAPGFFIDRVDYLADSEAWLDGVRISDGQVSAVPEPSSMALLAAGLVLLASRRLRRR